MQGCHEPNLAAENFRGSIFEGRFLECRFSRDDFSRVDFSSVDRDKGPLSKGRLRSKGPLSKVHMRPVVLCSTPGGSNECRSCQPDRRPPLRACGAQCAPRDEEALKRKAETRRDAAKNLDDAHKPRTANHREGPPCHEGGGGGRHGGRLQAVQPASTAIIWMTRTNRELQTPRRTTSVGNVCCPSWRETTRGFQIAQWSSYQRNAAQRKCIAACCQIN